MKLTERSAKWMEKVVANSKSNTGRTLQEWTVLAKKARVKDAKTLRAWSKEQGLSIVYASALTDALFPSEDKGDEDLVAAQYAGEKGGLRPIYDAVVEAASAFGPDVEVA